MFKVDTKKFMVDFLPTVFMLLLLCPLQGFSQDRTEDYYPICTLTKDDGLPDANINGLLFDDKGFVWISTFGGGLARYDGDTFVNFSPATETPISSYYLTQCEQDDYGRLWIAGSGGIDILDMNTLKAYPVPDVVKATYRHSYCNAVVKSEDGCMWFTIGNLIHRVSFSDDGQTFNVESIEISSSSSTNNHIALCDVENDGSIWVSWNGRIYKVRPVRGEGLVATPVQPNINIGEGNEGTAYLRTGSEVWVGTLRGLYRIDLASGTYKVYLNDISDKNSLSNSEISGLALSPDGDVVIGTLGGVNIYDSSNDRFIRYDSHTNIYGNKILPGDLVRCIKTNGAQIWVGQEVDGLTILMKKRLPIINVSHRENDPTSLPLTPIRSLYIDRLGHQWFGATEHGLYLHLGDMRFKYFNTQNSGLSHNTLTAFTEDGQGRLWMGSVEGDMNYISTVSPGTVYVPKDSDSEIAGRIDLINQLIYDSINNYIWILAREGLFYYDLTELVFREYKESIFMCTGGTIEDGKLWMSSQDGLRIIDLKTFSYVLHPEIPASFSLVPDGDYMWFGTFAHGVYKARKDLSKDSGITVYTKENGLADNRVRGLLLDGEYMWITTENGLSRFDTLTGSMSSFDVHDGLKMEAFCENSIGKDDHGTIYLGQKRGLSLLRSSYVFPDSYCKPKIVISGAIVGQSLVNLLYDRSISIHEKERELIFQISDLSYVQNSRIRYEYRLFPEEKEWIPTYRSGRFIRYGKVPGGNYKMQARALDEEGNVISMDEVMVSVKPFFYRTWWFALIVVLMVLALILQIVKWRTRAISRNQEKLQKEVDRQTRLLSEQKRQIQEKVDELSEQNHRLLRQNEILASHNVLTYRDPADSDSMFVDKVMTTIQELYKQPDLDIAMFSDVMGMSRSVLNERLNATIGQSIAQFIRLYRLNVAKEIIINGTMGDMNVSEIAYEVGFNDPKYFTRCFTKQFGIAPSVMLNGNLGKQDDVSEE